MLIENCFCGSGLSYLACCKPYINNDVHVPTAEALLRSRYSAYVSKNVDYILSTYHPEAKHKPTRETLIRNTESIIWHGLNIIRTEQGKDENEIFIEYTATYSGELGARLLNYNIKSMVRRKTEERSHFLKYHGRWYYMDGGPLKKIERNSLCYCGSRKKYKHCCINKIR